MVRAVQRIGQPIVVVLVVLGALAVSRYFLPQPPFVVAPNLHLLARHRFLFLGHIGGGLVAAITGLLQFSSALRRRRPDIHRAFGKLYVLAVFFAGSLAFVLGPYLFRAFSMPATLKGVPAMLAVGGIAPNKFFPAFLAFEALAPTWIALTAMAYIRARQRRFDEHRAWMLRSYSLTFAFVSVRLISGPLMLLTHSGAIAIALAIWSWTLNLVVAEWLIRGGERTPRPIALAAKA